MCDARFSASYNVHCRCKPSITEEVFIARAHAGIRQRPCGKVTQTHDLWFVKVVLSLLSSNEIRLI
eukprot:5166819-Amphidinium_carterae.1